MVLTIVLNEESKNGYPWTLNGSISVAFDGL